MTRPQNRLTAVQIKAAAPGKLQDGGGLVLDKRRAVMLRWAEFVTGQNAKVVTLFAGGAQNADP